MEEVKISVIIPIYNQEKYVKQCIDSVMSQSLREIEAICIDDGSTDGSYAIVEGLAKRDSRIRVIHRQNKGVGYTRNEGIGMARGEFVSFMDPDDYFPDENVLEKLFLAAKRNSAKIVGGSMWVRDEAKGKTVPKNLFPGRFFDCKFIEYRDFQYDYGFQRYIFNREMLNRGNIVFPPYKRFQDPPFLVRAMIAAERFYTIPDPTYVYRWSRRFSNWDDERVLHLVQALRDDLRIAAENRLWDLFDLTLSRVQRDFKQEIADHSTTEVLAVRKEILDLCVKVAGVRMPIPAGTTMPMVSVVLPIYNAEKYLVQCLDSVVSQTLKNIELICVNDGSTDKSYEIIKEYAARDKRVRWINKPNSGYGHSMNCGIRLARGKYIGIVEPDDYVRLDMFASLVEVAERTNVDFVKSGVIYHWDGKDDKEVKITEHDSLLNRVLEIKKEPLIFDAIMNIWTGIYRRDFLKANNIRLTETPGASYQDNSFYLQTHFLAKTAYLMDKAFYVYRQDNEASSINSTGKAFAIFEEYRRDAMVFDRRPDLKPIYFGQFLYRKYRSYKYHFSRVKDACKAGLLRRMSEEFAQHDKNGEIDYSLMPKVHQDILRLIIKDWPEYFRIRTVAAEKSKYASELATQKTARIKNWEERCAFLNRWKAEREILSALINSGDKLPGGVVRPPSGALREDELKGDAKFGLMGVKIPAKSSDENLEAEIKRLESLLAAKEKELTRVKTERDRLAKQSLKEAEKSMVDRNAVAEQKAARIKNWKERTAFMKRWRAERAILDALLGAGAELPAGAIRPPVCAPTEEELAGVAKYGMIGRAKAMLFRNAAGVGSGPAQRKTKAVERNIVTNHQIDEQW